MMKGIVVYMSVAILCATLGSSLAMFMIVNPQSGLASDTMISIVSLSCGGVVWGICLTVLSAGTLNKNKLLEALNPEPEESQEEIPV